MAANCYIAPIERCAKLRESSERRDHEHEKTMDRQGKARIAPIERCAKLRESSERRDHEHEKTMDRQGKARDSA